VVAEALSSEHQLNYEASADSLNSGLVKGGAPVTCLQMSDRSFATCSGVSGGGVAAISRAHRKAASLRGVPLLRLFARVAPTVAPGRHASANVSGQGVTAPCPDQILPLNPVAAKPSDGRCRIVARSLDGGGAALAQRVFLGIMIEVIFAGGNDPAPALVAAVAWRRYWQIA
jgi:hypothetical protein